MPTPSEAIPQVQDQLAQTDADDAGIMLRLEEGATLTTPGMDYTVTLHGSITDSMFAESVDVQQDDATAVGTVRPSQDDNTVDVWIGTGGSAGFATVVNAIGTDQQADLVVWLITEDTVTGPVRVGIRESRVLRAPDQETLVNVGVASAGAAAGAIAVTGAFGLL